MIEKVTREEIGELLSGFNRFMGEIIPLYSRYSDTYLPNEDLPVIQYFSTEAKIHYLKINEKSFLAWDLRRIQHIQNLLKCYLFSSHRRGPSLEQFGQSNKYRIERLTAQYLLDQLHVKNNLFLRLEDMGQLSRFSTHFFEKCQGILKQEDPNGLVFPQEQFPFLEFTVSTVDSLTLDHEIIHYAERMGKNVIEHENQFLDPFINFLKNAGEVLIFNEFGLYDWQYLYTVEIGATLKKALYVLENGNKDIREEIYADLIAVRGTIRWFLKEYDYHTYPIENKAIAFSRLYESIMLWQNSHIYFDGLNFEVEHAFGLENKERSFLNSDLGTRRFLVNAYCWFFLQTSINPDDEDPLSGKDYQMMKIHMEEVERNLQGFLTILSQIGLNIHNYFGMIKLTQGPEYDKLTLQEKMVYENNFPRNKGER